MQSPTTNAHARSVSFTQDTDDHGLSPSFQSTPRACAGSHGASPSVTPRAKGKPAAVPPGMTPEEFHLASGRMPLPGLPPKSAEEASEHMREVSAMQRRLQAALRGEVVEPTPPSPGRVAAQEARRLQDEDRRTKRWLVEVLPNFDAVRGSDSVQRLWAAGLPEAIRPIVWKAALGNDLGVTPDVFDTCVAKAHRRERLMANDPSSAALLLTPLPHAAAQIGCDVPRTNGPQSGSDTRLRAECDSDSATDRVASLPETERAEVALVDNASLASLDEPAVRSNETLATVLKALVELRPDVGYVQGMSFLAAMLLQELPQCDAFVGLANLLRFHHLPLFYSVNARGMSAHMAIFDEALSAAAPDLAKRLTIGGVRPNLYVTDWWMTLFSRNLPYPAAARCWDLFLANPVYLYRISVALVVMVASPVADYPDEALIALTHVARHNIDADELYARATDPKAKPCLKVLEGIAARHLAPWSRRASSASLDLGL